MWVGDQRHDPATLPPGMSRHPLYRRLGGSQASSGRVQKIPPPPGFDPRTVQPVACRYTDWDIPASPEPMSTVGILAGVKASPGRETVP